MASKQIDNLQREHAGGDSLVIYIESPKAKKIIENALDAHSEQAVSKLKDFFGEENVKVLEFPDKRR